MTEREDDRDKKKYKRSRETEICEETNWGIETLIAILSKVKMALKQTS